MHGLSESVVRARVALGDVVPKLARRWLADGSLCGYISHVIYIYMKPDLDTLSDGTRRHMLALLQVEPELCVCEMEAALQELQPVISRHLALLRDAGWVTSRREGRRMYYRLAALPDWAQLLVRALAEGGVVPKALSASRSRLERFDGRPVRLTRRAS